MKQLLLALCCCLSLTACVKWELTGPAGPAGPQGPPGQKPPGADTSTIYGRVFVINEFTYLLVPVDSVTVTLHINTDSSLTTMADTAGYFYFHAVSTGTYNLTYSRPDFGEMKVFSLTHISGGTLNTRAPDIPLLQIPVQTVVDTAWFDRQLNGDLLFRYNLRPTLPENAEIVENFEFYFSKSSNVSVNNYLFRMDGQYSIRKDTLNKYFAPGDSLYCRIYTLNKYFASTMGPNGFDYAWLKMKQPIYYIDPATGLYTYPSRSRKSALISTVY